MYNPYPSQIVLNAKSLQLGSQQSFDDASHRTGLGPPKTQEGT